MKLKFILLLTLLAGMLHAQNLKPYTIGIESQQSIQELKQKVEANLKANGLQIVGQYQPANDQNRYLFVYTSTELLDAVKSVGGLTGFAATQRIAITTESGKTIVSYTTPSYWGNAYFQDNYSKVAANYTKLEAKLKKAMSATGSYVGTTFGSEKGVDIEDIQEYQYMMGMPEFDDTEELKEFNSYSEAISKIDGNLKTGKPNVKQVYKVEVPRQNLALYGIALQGENGEQKFMPKIDIGSPKHTAFLPYEILVLNNEVHMLHGRYRIALSFPDLTMGTFSKIMSTPGEIEELLEQLVE